MTIQDRRTHLQSLKTRLHTIANEINGLGRREGDINLTVAFDLTLKAVVSLEREVERLNAVTGGQA